MEESVSFISQARLLLGVGVASLQTLVVFRLINLDYFFFQSGRHDSQARTDRPIVMVCRPEEATRGALASAAMGLGDDLYRER